MDRYFKIKPSSSLTKEQNEAYDAFKQGRNLLITGQAGTGKSHLIKKLVEYCNQMEKTVAITAMTGTASSIIGGKTIHSWGSLGIGNRDANYYSERILASWPKKTKWKKCRVLIIDEVSMLTAQFFELIEEVARNVRGSGRPFGGIQVILIGDFYQLPPVSKASDPQKFCFESERWEDVIDQKITLTEIIRQKEPAFQKVLSEVRVGRPSRETIDIIRSRVGVKPSTDTGILPTIIYSKREDVDKINEREFNKLTSDEILEYDVRYEITGDKALKMKDDEYAMWVDIINKDNNYVQTLQLAVGTQVMLLTNLDQERGLVNGSRGVITDFVDGFPYVRFINGDVEKIVHHSYSYEINATTQIIAKQIPLDLAWCTTIHKSQGQSLDYIQINIGRNIFECGQTYVALSRVRSLEGLFIEEFDESKIRVNPVVAKYFNE
jgi:ATP-dependent DNA helicase PIF1